MNTVMLYTLGLFLAGWILTALWTPFFIRMGRRWSVMDEPGERKVHDTPVPRTGGMAIYAALATVTAVGIPLLPALRRSFDSAELFYISVALGATMVFAVGVYDDFKGASVPLRLAVEIGAAAIVIFAGGITIERIGVPLAGKIEFGAFSYPITALWIVGVTNALNIIDGLDGLAGGIAFIACFGVFSIAAINGQTMGMATLALLAGACLGFLRYNSHPAQVFLGDGGALLLGFLLACISVVTSHKLSAGLALIIPMQMLAVPLLDTLYSMSRRVVRELIEADEWSVASLKSMFRADRAHIHHILLDVGFSHPRAVWILYFLSTLIALFGLASALATNDWALLLFLLAGLAGFLIIRHFGDQLPFIHRWKKAQKENEPPPKE